MGRRGSGGRGVAGERRLDLDRARGLGILLVVFGHLMGRGRPEGMDWYAAAFVAVYTFHMPFFMYLSGSTAWLSGQATAAPAAWPRHIARRAQRLLAPFVLMGLVIVAGKYFASKVMHVDGVPPGLAEGLVDAFWTTAESPVIMIWYLWVLFFVASAAPVLLRVPGVPGRLRVVPALVAGLVLFVVGLPPIAYLDRLAAHAVFFAVGLAVAQAGPRALAAIDRHWPAALALLGLGIAATLAGWLDRRWALLVCGLPALPGLHGLVRAVGDGAAAGPLAWLGRYSMVIYLFNTIAIGLAKAALIMAGLAWTAAGATLASPLLMLAGVLAPVLGKRLVLRRMPAIDRMTD
jgi:fucose 4-O-acetylase-like acetyltransferase